MFTFFSAWSSPCPVGEQFYHLVFLKKVCTFGEFRSLYNVLHIYDVLLLRIVCSLVEGGVSSCASDMEVFLIIITQYALIDTP